MGKALLHTFQLFYGLEPLPYTGGYLVQAVEKDAFFTFDFTAMRPMRLDGADFLQVHKRQRKASKMPEGSLHPCFLAFPVSTTVYCQFLFYIAQQPYLPSFTASSRGISDYLKRTTAWMVRVIYLIY